MFERFTHSARVVVIGAQEEARRLNHGYIGTEHLLLALLNHGEAVAELLGTTGLTSERVDAAIARLLGAAPGALGPADADALRAIGIDLDAVRARIEENFGPVPLAPPPEPPRRRFGLRRARRQVTRPTCQPWSGHIPFTPRAKKVLELSVREALRLGHKHIGAEHILLGLLREGDGIAAKIIAEAEVDMRDLRERAEAALRDAA